MNVLNGDVSSRGVCKIINKAIQNKNLKIAVLLGDNYIDELNLPSLTDLEALAYNTESYINVIIPIFKLVNLLFLYYYYYCYYY